MWCWYERFIPIESVLALLEQVLNPKIPIFLLTDKSADSVEIDTKIIEKVVYRLF